MTFGFLEGFVQEQLASGKLDYDPEKSQVIGAADELYG